MANTKTAKKHILISERNRVRNMRVKTQMKNALKKARLAIESSDDAPAAKLAVDNAVRVLHRTATRRVIKRQNASRRVSRLMLAYNAAFSSKPTTEQPVDE